MRFSRSWLSLLALLAVLAQPATALAQAAEELEQAKSLFREGVALLNAGDPERALEYFLRSRSIVPSGKNTANAAICLDRLGRYDEALEFYEELLSRFSADLDEQDRKNLAPTMAALRDRLARLDVSANVQSELIVDSRARGSLPRPNPLRVLPGSRRVRVVKEGYTTFEQVVQVKAGDVLAIDAVLEPLAGLGAVRIEHGGAAGAEVWVDGKRLGESPWEGTLPTGRHLLQVIAGERGSMPETIDVIERKTLLLRVSTQNLGQVLRVVPEPKTATLFLGDTRLGTGEWIGRLPVGEHEIRAQAPGYVPRKQGLTSAKDAASQSLILALQRDPATLPQAQDWFFAAGLDTGLLYAPTLNGGQEDFCPASCNGSPSALGARFEAQLEARHRLGFGGVLALGYAFASQQEFNRPVLDEFDGIPITYALRQQLAFGGPYGRAGARAAARLPWALELHGELGFGLLLARYEAAAAGVAWTNDDYEDSEPAGVTGLAPITELSPFITTGLELERRFERIGIFLELSGWFFPGFAPPFYQAEIVVDAGCVSPNDPGCAPSSNRTADERVRGPFFFLTPALGARYHF